MSTTKKYWGSVVALMLLLVLTSTRIRWFMRPVFPFRPNIVLITLDAFRFKTLIQLSSQVSKKPFFPEFIKEGLFFSHCYTTSPQTLPAHASLFTGLSPRTHQVQFEALFRLSEAFTTLPEILQDQGKYETLAITASSLLSKESGLAQGFQIYDEDFSQPPREVFNLFYPNQRRANEVIFQFQQWLKQYSGDKPFFAFLNFFDAHSPSEAPFPFHQENIQPYQAELYFLDQQIQNLMQQMKQTQYFDNTLFVFVSTSGEGLQEHQEYEHGLFLYESTVCGSAFFYAPRWIYPVTIESPISILDIVPTFLDLLNLKAPENLQGKSLSPAFFYQPLASRDLFIETQLPRYAHHWESSDAVVSEIPDLHFWGKYIFRGCDSAGLAREELYDLKLDASETKNLAEQSDFKEIMQQFREKRNFFLQELKPFSKDLQDYTRPLNLIQERDLRIFNLPWVDGNTLPICSEDPWALGKMYYFVCYAKELLRGQKWEQAEQQLQKMLLLDPNHSETLFLLGQLALRKQDFTTALSLFNHPSIHNRVDSNLQQALIFSQQQDWYSAEHCLLALLGRYPEYSEVHKQLAYLYKEIGLSQKAVKHFELFLKFDSLQNPQEIITIRSLLQKLKS
ncbi:MAG: sulfatase-like hydrolase/transferase [Planctomycetota bacterium]